MTDLKLDEIDRGAFSVAKLHEPGDERAFWRGLSPEERLAALEYMRRTTYGYSEAECHISRVLEVARLRPR